MMNLNPTARLEKFLDERLKGWSHTLSIAIGSPNPGI